MIVPVDRDGIPFARKPWATLTLIWLCLLVFLPTQITGRNSQRAGVARLEEAVSYFRQHPHLALDPRLRELLWPGAPARAQQAIAAWRAAAVTAGQPQSTFHTLEQTELDGLTHAGFDALQSLPQAAWGITPLHFRFYNLFTYPLVHGYGLALLGNLIFLYLFGSHLEGRWRRAPLIGLWLLAGAAAAIGFTARFPSFSTPLLGASGAVAGLAGAFAVEHRHHTVAMRWGLDPGQTRTVALPALVWVLLWAGCELLDLVASDVLVPDSAAAGAAYWAHLAGFGCGAGLTALAKVSGVHRRYLSAAVGPVSDSAPVQRPASQQLARRPRTGSVGDRWDHLQQALRRDPGNSELIGELWGLATAGGRQREMAPELLRHVRTLTANNQAETALHWYQEFRDHVPDGPIPLALEVSLGRCLSAQGLEEAAQQVLTAAADRADASDAPGTLLRLARMVDGCRRANVVQLALDHPELPQEKRREAQQLVPDLNPAASPAPHAPAGDDTKAEPGLAALPAVPLGIKKQRLGLAIEGGGRRTLDLGQIKAIAAAAVYDGGVEPDYVLDLVLDFPVSSTAPVQVVRLHSNGFDPRALVPAESEVGDALLSFAGHLLNASGALWLLGETAAQLRTYDHPQQHRKALLSAVRLNIPRG